MEKSIYIDTRLLRDHVSIILEEKRIAQQLYSQVNQLKRSDESVFGPQCHEALSKIDTLIRYYQMMANALEEVGDNAVALSREISRILQDDTDEVKRHYSNVML